MKRLLLFVAAVALALTPLSAETHIAIFGGAWQMCSVLPVACVPNGTQQWIITVSTDAGPEVTDYRADITIATDAGYVVKTFSFARSDQQLGVQANGIPITGTVHAVVLGNVKVKSLKITLLHPGESTSQDLN